MHTANVGNGDDIMGQSFVRGSVNFYKHIHKNNLLIKLYLMNEI